MTSKFDFYLKLDSRVPSILDLLTIESRELSHKKTPRERASDHFIFPPQAITEEDSSRSWLSLWNAQIMSRYRSLPLHPIFLEVFPSKLELSSEEDLRLRM